MNRTMLTIGLISLFLAIPLFSSFITSTQLIRITSIVLLYSAALSYNSLYVETTGSGYSVYSGLFHVTAITTYMEMFLFLTGAIILLSFEGRQSVVSLDSMSESHTKGRVYNSNSDKNVLHKEKTSARQLHDPLLGKNSSRRTSVLSSAELTKGPVPEYSMIILFTTIGGSFLIASSDLVSMYLSIELQSFAVYILAALYRDSESATSAGLKYFLLGALSSALILLGSSLVYSYTGLTNFENISLLANVPDLVSDPQFSES